MAAAIEGATVGRQFKEEDILLVDVPESDARELFNSNRLNFDERQVMEELFKVKRKAENFWGR